MKWLKIIGGTIGIIALLVGSMRAWYWLEYGTKSPLIAHKRIMITLPYRMEDPTTGINPLGEIESVHPDGHGGIDFQWQHSVPLVATADGVITSIAKAKDANDNVLYVTLKTGQYKSVYKEVTKLGSGIQKGSKLRQGDIVGYPHCSKPDGIYLNCQVHWEFSYASGIPTFTNHVDRLCPLTYFDSDALTRLIEEWDKVKARHTQGPTICQNAFANLNQ